MPFRTRNFARLCAASALAAGATGFFAAPAFAAVPDSADFAIVTDDITGPNGAPLAPGSDAQVFTTITNASSVVITGFELSVTLPVGVTFKGAAADGWTTCDYVGQTVTCELSDGWNLVPVGDENEAEETFSSWEVPFKVAIAADAKGPKIEGGKSTGKITSAAEYETGDKAKIAADAAEFKPASFTGTNSGVQLASFKGTGGKHGGGDKDWSHGKDWGKGGGKCGQPPKPPKPPTKPPVTPSTKPPVSSSPSPSVSPSPSPSTASPSPSPSASTTPPSTPSPSPSTTPPTTAPPVTHSAAFAALVAVPGGNGGGGEEPPLPNTGVQVGVIGGLGAAVVVAGAAMFMMARRRRVVTVAPGDGNSSL